MSRDTVQRTLNLEDCASILEMSKEALVNILKHKPKKWGENLSEANVTKAMHIVHELAPTLKSEPYKVGTKHYILVRKTHQYLAKHVKNTKDLVLELPRRAKRMYK